MAKSQVKWYGPQCTKAMRTETQKRLNKAAMWLQTFIREKLSEDQPKVRVKAKGKKAGYFRGFSPSLPGRYPKRLSGQLVRSISWEAGSGYARVGTNLRYGRWLETGTRRMARRPWLTLACQAAKMQLSAILNTGRPL